MSLILVIQKISLCTIDYIVNLKETRSSINLIFIGCGEIFSWDELHRERVNYYQRSILK